MKNTYEFPVCNQLPTCTTIGKILYRVTLLSKMHADFWRENCTRRVEQLCSLPIENVRRSRHDTITLLFGVGTGNNIFPTDASELIGRLRVYCIINLAFYEYVFVDFHVI